MTSSRTGAAALLGVLVTALVGGCGSEDDERAAPSPSPTTTTPSASPDPLPTTTTSSAPVPTTTAPPTSSAPPPPPPPPAPVPEAAEVVAAEWVDCLVALEAGDPYVEGSGLVASDLPGGVVVRWQVSADPSVGGGYATVPTAESAEVLATVGC